MYYILKFDMVLLNKGNGYKVFDGIFIVFMFGIYVFSWLFMFDVYVNVFIELIKNVDVIGNRFVDFLNLVVYDFFIGIVVVDIFQGDYVYV